MNIKSLKLTNFRNWQNYQLDFDNVTILIGQNGVGKTNLVEAVWLASTGRSWRTRHDGEMIEWGQEFARIVLKLEKTEKNQELELFWQKGDKPIKQLKLNGAKHRLIDLLGTIPAVLFNPEALDIVNGAPALRRRFMDIILSQTDRHYALNLLEYHRVLRERNKLLAAIKLCYSQPDELEFWDEKLVELGGFMIKSRESLINFFNQTLTGNYQKISGANEKLELRYKPSAESDRLSEILTAGREREIEQSTSLYGPHRDDFQINLNQREAADFASRGEFRSAVLALKMAELDYLAGKIGEKPILILDDIFSELDAARRSHLAKVVSGQQTVITTTDLDHLDKKLQKTAKIIEIK